MTDNTLTLQCGVTLHLQPVKPTILQNILAEFGDIRLVRDPALLMQLTDSKKMAALQATEKLFTYCAGWGVTNEPPDGDNELLELLGVGSDKPHIRRARWIQHELAADQQELGAIVGAVMALTFEPEAPSGVLSANGHTSEASAQAKDAEIAALKAQLAQLQGE